MQQFFYDQQIRRFLLQFARIFSNFQIEYGRANDTGAATLIRVPVRYGDATRNAQTILQQNSASALPSTPLITFYITGMDYDRPRMQEPYFVSNTQVRQRTYDADTETYETTQGNAFTIERLMPVPYKMTLNADFWTSNTNQKFQLFEQIATLFNPALEIQSTDNYIDWTSLSVVELDRVNWSSRTIPVGTEDPIDIMTMTFSLPIWISSPAKVKKLGVVEKIIMSVYDAQGDAANAITNSDLLLGTRQKITPYGYQTLLIGNKLQALKPSAVVIPGNDNTNPQTAPPSNEFWQSIVNMYGALRPGISQVRLDNPWDDSEIIGFVSFDPTDDRFLLFDVDADTIPQNTMLPVNAVIDPLRSGPGAGLPAAATGQRYLILEDIGNPENTVPGADWGDLVAQANDIIEFNGSVWIVTFEAGVHFNNVQYITNITSSLQYRWTGSEWVKSYEGLYPGGEWSLVL
jgi:hypothetical protein